MMLLSLLLACGTKMDEAAVKSTVEKAFLENNPTEGHYGWEILGKSQWFTGKGFDMDCLMDNELAYVNYDKIGQITPSYPAQHSITAVSKKGYCIDMGHNLSLKIDKMEPLTEVGSLDIQMVTVSFELQDAAPWVSCMVDDVKTRIIQVESKDGVPQIKPEDLEKLQFQPNNGCPNPVPALVDRKVSPRPTSAPESAPSLEDIKGLAKSFDDALFAGDHSKAYGMLSCVNLYEKNVWGTCTPSDLLPVGPSTHGDEKMEPPWMEYTQYNFDAITKIVKDKQDPTLFHVLMPHRKNKNTRSFSVQWAEGRWKLFGVVSIMGAGLTPIRLMNDLHEKQYREAFEKRLAGEEVDYKGKPLNPNAEEAE